MRINKYLSYYGICSRREADRRIEAGRVSINGQIAEKGDDVQAGDEVTVDGEIVREQVERVVLAYHKPVGVICTTGKKEHPNLDDVIDYPSRVFPVGRLDRDSSGLLLLTNDGAMAEELMRGRNDHEKEYVVHVNKPMKKEILRAMEQGVPLEERMTKPCRTKQTDDKSFHIVLTQGMNRQIRRMCRYFGYRVMALERIRVEGVLLGDLPPGAIRELTEAEAEALFQLKPTEKC